MAERVARAAPEPPAGESEEELRQALLRMTSPGYAALRAELEALRGQIGALGDLLENAGERSVQEDQALHGRLAELHGLLESVEARLADPQAEAERLAPVLVPALADRAQGEREAFAEAVAPIIGPAIRHQIRESRQDIIDSLYPLIGQIIGKAISEAFRELTRQIDTRLRGQLDLRARLRHLSARLRGVSEAELLLREALPYSIQRVFLIHRETGLLLDQLAISEAGSEDSDIISGMLTAIRDFVRDSFGRRDEELEEVTYGDQRILLEGGQYAYLAVVLTGVEPPGYAGLMKAVIGQINLQDESRLAHFNGDMSSLPDFTSRLAPLLAPTPDSLGGAAQAGGLNRGQKWALGLGLSGLAVLCALAIFQGVFTYRLWGVAFHSPPPTAAPTDTPVPVPVVLPSPVPPSATPPPSPSPAPTATATKTASPSPAPSLTPTLNLYILSGKLNLRSGPGLTYPVLDTILTGEAVVILETNEEWARVRWSPEGAPAQEGWVWVRFLEQQP